MNTRLAELEAEYAASHVGVGYFPKSINVARGALSIGDPCYAKQSDLSLVVDARNGRWNVRETKKGRIVLEHASPTSKLLWSAIDLEVGVDSGQIFACAEENLPTDAKETPEWQAWYEEICAVHGRVENGWNIGTGDDGTFKIRVWRNANGFAEKIKVFVYHDAA